MRQPTFHQKVQDKYNKLNNFKTEIRNIIIMNSFNLKEIDKFPIHMSWLFQEGLRFVHMLNAHEKEKCQTSSRPFE